MLRICATIVFSTLVLQAPAFAEDENPATISIRATASVNAVPDLVIITGGVVTHGKTAGQAVSGNSEAMAKVLQAYRDAGIDEKDIATSGFSIQPQYVYPKKVSGSSSEAPRIVGYSVTNRVTVKVRDRDALGGILDKVVSSGANVMDGLSFTLADPVPVLDEARKKAAAAARRKAQLYAASFGVRLGRIVAISEATGRPAPRGERIALAARSSSDVPIAVGEQSYSASVTVTWEIED